MNTRLQIKRGNKSTLDAFMSNDFLRLKSGEQQFTTDEKKLYISDGTKAWPIGAAGIGTFGQMPYYGMPGQLFYVNSGNYSGTFQIDDGTSQVNILSGVGDGTTVTGVYRGPYQLLGENDLIVNYTKAYDFYVDERTTNYYYSETGDLTRAVINSDGTVLNDITYIYDSSSTLIRTIAIVNDVTLTTSYFYNDNRDLTTITKNVDGTWINPNADYIMSFLDLNDTPETYQGHGGKVLTVSPSELGVTFVDRSDIARQYTPRDITGPTIVYDGDICFVNSSQGSFDITLMENPRFGSEIRFIEVSDTFEENPITIRRNGKRIMGLDEDLLQNTNSTFTLYFHSDEYGQRFY